jgi:hypothetical protein
MWMGMAANLPSLQEIVKFILESMNAIVARIVTFCTGTDQFKESGLEEHGGGKDGNENGS